MAIGQRKWGRVAGLAAVIIVGTLYELLTTVMVLRWPGRVSPVVLSAGDILAISVLMLASGGADSHIGYVAPGLLATVALVLGLREVAIACAAGAVALVLVCLPDLVGGEVDAWAQLAVYLGTMAWVFLVYLTLAAWLARNRQRLQKEGDRRRVLLATVLEAEAAQRQALTTDLHEAHSIGPAAIRERVGAAGGLLELQTTPGMGTCVAVRLPV